MFQKEHDRNEQRDWANFTQKLPHVQVEFQGKFTLERAKVCFHNTMVDRITSQREGCDLAQNYGSSWYD